MFRSVRCRLQILLEIQEAAVPIRVKFCTEVGSCRNNQLIRLSIIGIIDNHGHIRTALERRKEHFANEADPLICCDRYRTVLRCLPDLVSAVHIEEIVSAVRYSLPLTDIATA